MKPTLKDIIAILLLLFAILLAFIAMLTPPPGEIHDSVLYLFAQILIYCASIFGIDSYVRSRVKEREGWCTKR